MLYVWQFVLYTEALRDILRDIRKRAVSRVEEATDKLTDGQVIRQEESRRKESSVEQKENALTLPTSCGLISASQLVRGR